MEKRLDIGRFRPTSWADFKRYAANLAWLLEIELSRGHELLARSYGFSGCHELQAELKKKGTPGFSGHADFIELTANERILRLSADELNLTLTEIPKRTWLVRDCRFFALPSQHRSAFRRIRLRLQVSEGSDFEGRNSSAADYAVLHELEEGGGVRLNFTELGQAVFDAAIALEPDFVQPGDWRCNERKMLALIERYPKNPWVHAVYVYSFGKFYFQNGWADELPSNESNGDGYDVIDSHPGFPAGSRRYAEKFLVHAKSAINLFNELLDGQERRHVDYQWSDDGCDTFYYPAILSHGAYVAANAGEVDLSIRWAQVSREILGQDNFGSRDLLAALYLNEGRAFSSIKKLYRHGEYEGWASLCLAASAVACRDKKSAAKYMTALFGLAWTPFEMFGGVWPEARNKCGVFTNRNSAACFAEFHFRTDVFWKRERRVFNYFEEVCLNVSVRRLVLTLHEAEKKARGLAFMAEEEAARRKAEYNAAKNSLMTNLPLFLEKLWSSHMESLDS